ncbi:Os05g0468301 [Oryza sativa Japonica Group]|uniref:Os05g0468301 protein n=1 Tax=Oryza sativa subsp. japonica TaxID=39947 RepID=A0A0P0WNQ8_ORYSJ|nr:Os05g0468301 [Oryza sativa Japonica Group]
MRKSGSSANGSNETAPQPRSIHHIRPPNATGGWSMIVERPNGSEEKKLGIASHLPVSERKRCMTWPLTPTSITAYRSGGPCPSPRSAWVRSPAAPPGEASLLAPPMSGRRNSWPVSGLQTTRATSFSYTPRRRKPSLVALSMKPAKGGDLLCVSAGAVAAAGREDAQGEEELGGARGLGDAGGRV